MAFDLEAAIEAAVARGVRRALEEAKPYRAVEAELLSVKQAAALANVSRDTIRAWLEEGLLNRYGSAHAVRVRRDELLNVKPKCPAAEKSPRELALQLLTPKGR